MSRSARRTHSTASVSGKRRGKRPALLAAEGRTAREDDEIAERARRLGITPERVLKQYARIAFADLRRVADWGPGGFVLKNPEELSDEDAAAISEVVAAGGAGNYRVKLYDKKAALDAIARHLGMFLRAPRRPEDVPDDLAEDAREVLARRLARLAAAGATD